MVTGLRTMLYGQSLTGSLYYSGAAKNIGPAIMVMKGEQHASYSRRA
jgi:hypothetical protein